MKRILWLVLLSALSCPVANGQLLLRAAYFFNQQPAWSARPILPAYQLIPLDKVGRPQAVTDSGLVLLKTEDKQFLRGLNGRWQNLGLTPEPGNRAFLMPDGTAFGVINTHSKPEFFSFPPQSSARTSLPAPAATQGPSHVLTGTYKPTRSGGMAVRVVLQGEQNIGSRKDETLTFLRTSLRAPWKEISRYTMFTYSDYSISENGSKWSDFILAADGTYAGNYGSGSYSHSGNPYDEAIDNFSWEYRLLDKKIQIEPLALNSNGTLIGLFEGPPPSIRIHDAFGARALSADEQLFSSDPFRLSNPHHGRELIVQGERAWCRMVEHDFSDHSLDRMSPDFWQGKLTDLIRYGLEHWSELEITCISSNGNMAGMGSFADPETGQTQTRPFVLLPSAFVTDTNRDGAITYLDRGAHRSSAPLRMWINDDHDRDSEDPSSRDLPGQNPHNAQNGAVDGLRDAVDFFPVYLDLRHWMPEDQPLSNYHFVLRHPEEAVNVVFAAALPRHAGKHYRTDLPTGFGENLQQPFASANATRVTRNGVRIPMEFLQSLRKENKGILLLEGVKATTEPLYLDAFVNHQRVFTSSLPLSISPVRHFFRILNLRSADDPRLFDVPPGPWITDMEEPSNLPDSLWEPHTPALAHIHGFNWREDEVPAAHSELFKRLYQAGLKAPFIGVTWHSDQGSFDLLNTSFDYNENVINAFVAARHLTSNLHGFSRPLNLIAHSLGTVVAASAIVDHGLPVHRLLMVNAAIPMEALAGTEAETGKMVHPDWKDPSSSTGDYREELRPDKWWQRFSPEDGRSALRWQNRFADLPDHVDLIHFYSTGEEVLQKSDGSIPDLFNEVILLRQGVWAYNEYSKGTDNLASSLTGDSHGGWGFNRQYMRSFDPNGPSRPPGRQWFPMVVSEANQLPLDILIDQPFFKPFSSGDSDFPAWSNGQWLYQLTSPPALPDPQIPFSLADSAYQLNHAKLLGEAIPAVSHAAGAIPPPREPLFDSLNMDSLFRQQHLWPDRAKEALDGRWLHSDFLRMALPFVHRLFRTCVQRMTR